MQDESGRDKEKIRGSKREKKDMRKKGERDEKLENMFMREWKKKKKKELRKCLRKKEK